VKPVNIQYYILLPLILFLSSCFKDNTEFIPDQNHLINSELLISDLVGKPASLILDLEGKTFFPLNEKLAIEIPDSSLEDYLGNIIRGKIKVEINELTSSKKNLLSCPESVTHDEILNCSKLFNIKIYHNNIPVIYQKPISIYLKSDEVDENVKLYILSHGEAEQNWTEAFLNNTFAYGNWKPNAGEDLIRGYKFILEQEAEWIMLGSSLGTREKKSLSLEIENTPSKFNTKNTLAFFISDDDVNVIFKMDYNPIEKKFYTDKSINNEQIKGKIVLISQFGKEAFEFGMTNAIINADNYAKVFVKLATKEEIKAMLNAL
jgi:hypothetical protein